MEGVGSEIGIVCSAGGEEFLGDIPWNVVIDLDPTLWWQKRTKPPFVYITTIWTCKYMIVMGRQVNY